MKLAQRIADWLETHWATPSYSGWVLAALTLCFFGAASNTMAGWLYVLSGLIIALLGLNTLMAMRSLLRLKVHRLPIEPVSAGDDLTIKLEIENPTPVPKTLLEIWDFLPYVLGEPQQTAIEVINPHSIYPCFYYLPTKRRGIYHWHELDIRTGYPLGLCFSRRTREVPAKALVYPQVLSLLQCPLVDTIGRDDSTRLQSDHRYQTASEGVTRTLRPYRYGDPMRMIHWRTSARLGEFKVRELEVITGGQDIIICLDSASSWQFEDFELAVIAAASLYFYASRSQMNVKLYTAASGVIAGSRTVLEALAAVESTEETQIDYIPSLPLIWITQNTSTLETLPPKSRWLFFPPNKQTIQPMLTRNFSGLIINSDEPLQQQLQRPLH